MHEDIDVLLAERAIQRVLEGGVAGSYVRGIRSRDDIIYRIPDSSRG